MDIPNDIVGEIGLHLNPQELRAITKSEVLQAKRCLHQEKTLLEYTGLNMTDILNKVREYQDLIVAQVEESAASSLRILNYREKTKYNNAILVEDDVYRFLFDKLQFIWVDKVIQETVDTIIRSTAGLALEKNRLKPVITMEEIEQARRVGHGVSIGINVFLK